MTCRNSINFEIRIKDRLCNFITLYCWSNQCLDKFESFLNNLELNLDSIMVTNHFLSVVFGDCSAKLCLGTIMTTKYEGS